MRSGEDRSHAVAPDGRSTCPVERFAKRPAPAGHGAHRKDLSRRKREHRRDRVVAAGRIGVDKSLVAEIRVHRAVDVVTDDRHLAVPVAGGDELAVGLEGDAAEVGGQVNFVDSLPSPSKLLSGKPIAVCQRMEDEAPVLLSRKLLPPTTILPSGWTSTAAGWSWPSKSFS